MATVVGIVEQARAWLPEFALRRRQPQGAQQKRSIRIAAAVDKVVLPRLAVTTHSRADDLGVANMVATLALDVDPAALRTKLDALLDDGMPVDTILVDVLAPAARRLGVLWDDDACDFVDVTMGLWRLQEIVRDLSSRVPAQSSRAWSALFASMPGDQHNFGAVMAEDVFRRDGWDTDILLDPTKSDLLAAVAKTRYDVVGLTVSCDDHIGLLPSLVSALRSVSSNPRLCIMLGGRVPTADPDIVNRVGADCTAPDARAAVIVAAGLVAANACREVFTA